MSANCAPVTSEMTTIINMKLLASRLCWLIFGLYISVECSAEAVTRHSPAAALANAVLDGLPGTAAAGTLQAGKISVAVAKSISGGRSTEAGKDEPLFEIGSVSKVFTGLLLSQAVEGGSLRLDQSIGSLLESSIEFKSKNTASITLRQLVTHTSCLPVLPENANVVPAAAQITQYTREQLWRALANTQIAKAAPCPSLYSNFGFAVLGELLSQRADKPWAELVRAQITAPLGMRDTLKTLSKEQAQRLPAAFRRDVPSERWETDAFAGAGGLVSTVSDLLVFSKALLAGLHGPLGRAAERLVTALAPYGTKSTKIGYAVFLPAAKFPVWIHAGLTGGYSAEWIVWPDTGEAVVLMVSNIAAPSRPIADSMVREPK